MSKQIRPDQWPCHLQALLVYPKGLQGSAKLPAADNSERSCFEKFFFSLLSVTI